jgi:hypothetical protein
LAFERRMRALRFLVFFDIGITPYLLGPTGSQTAIRRTSSAILSHYQRTARADH